VKYQDISCGRAAVGRAGERVADFSTGGMDLNVYVLERGDLYLAASLSIGADDMPGERGRAAGQALFSTG
jgi:hypothetical protein